MKLHELEDEGFYRNLNIEMTPEEAKKVFTWIKKEYPKKNVKDLAIYVDLNGKKIMHTDIDMRKIKKILGWK